jgi:hypothetical protein
MQAYCVKCRAKREIKNIKSIIMKNGQPATQGMCPVCGTKMFRIGKNGSPTGQKSKMSYELPGDIKMEHDLRYEPPGYEPPGGD